MDKFGESWQKKNPLINISKDGHMLTPFGDTSKHRGDEEVNTNGIVFLIIVAGAGLAGWYVHGLVQVWSVAPVFQWLTICSAALLAGYVLYKLRIVIMGALLLLLIGGLLVLGYLIFFTNKI